MKNRFKKLVIPENTKSQKALTKLLDKKPNTLKDWWRNKFRFTTVGWKLNQFLDFINEIKIGIRNIIKWTPIIWKDKNWDYSSIYSILLHKIDMNRRALVGSNLHEDVDRDNYWMTVALNLIDKIQNDKYQWEYLEFIKKDFRFIQTNISDSDEPLWEVSSKTERDDSKIYFKLNPSKLRLLKRDMPDFESWDDESIAIHISEYKQKQAKRILFRILETKMENWWI